MLDHEPLSARESKLNHSLNCFIPVLWESSHSHYTSSHLDITPANLAPAAPVSFSELVQQVVSSKREDILKAAEEELEREMALIKKHADDLTYQRTGKRPSASEEQKAANSASLMQVQLRTGAELGERTVITDTGDVVKVHYGHNVFNRMKLNQAKAGQNQQPQQAAKPTTATAAAAPASRSVSFAETQAQRPSFRFRSWSVPKGPSPDLHGFHAAPGLSWSSFVDAQATVSATAEEQMRLEEEVNRLENTMLIETGAEAHHTVKETVGTKNEAEDQSDHLEHENEEAFFGVENESPVANVHQEIEHDVHALVEAEAEAEEEADADVDAEESLNLNAAAEPVTSSWIVEAQSKSSRNALPSKISSAGGAATASPNSKNNASPVNQKTSSRKPTSKNGSSRIASTAPQPVTQPTSFIETQAKASTHPVPENPGWPFSQPEPREMSYAPPNVEELPTAGGYGNLNEYGSHPYDTLLHQAPPPSDRLWYNPGLAVPSHSQVQEQALTSSVDGSMPPPIATGPTAFQHPVPYFPSQNPPPLAPMDKPADVSATFLQGTANQYLRPAVRPISNQHELFANPPPNTMNLNSVRPTLSAGLNDQVAASTTAAGLDGIQAPTDDATLQFIANGAAGSPIGPHGDQVAMSSQLHNNGMRLLEVDANSQARSESQVDSIGLLNPSYGVPVGVAASAAAPAPPVVPSQFVDNRPLATSEFLQLPRQVPYFYHDLQVPGGSWAPVGHVDPSLMPPEYVADTPYFPAQSVGPAYPPAAIESPVNAGAHRAAPGYLGPVTLPYGLGGQAGALNGASPGGQLPFAPYV